VRDCGDTVRASVQLGDLAGVDRDDHIGDPALQWSVRRVGRQLRAEADDDARAGLGRLLIDAPAVHHVLLLLEIELVALRRIVRGVH
jgi:hypothetical protein